MASIYQKTAGDLVIKKFTVFSFRWVLLFAQMQSGKTTTYLYIACEAIRAGIVEKVVIFSGNQETELKDQVKSDCDIFVSNYCQEHGLNYITIRNKIVVKWGAELKRSVAESDTLFIWDESHAAQSFGMRPDKYLIENGISGDGDETKLRNRNNFFLSVSATPFSEVSDFIHQYQFKSMVKLEVGPEYFSLKDMLANGNIRPYNDWEQTLRNAFVEHVGAVPKYSIVRVRNDTMGQTVTDIASSCGWASFTYNGKRKDIASMNNLAVAPIKNTVVIIKAMCRMGKVVPKQHIAFCMETSNDPKTDVVLQSLLGRMMGWNANRAVVIYLNEKTFASDELNRYVRMYDGEEIIPGRATNIVVGCGIQSELYPIIPILIRASDRIVDGSRDDLGANEKSAIIESVKAAIRDGRCENHNEAREFEEIRQNIDAFDYEQFKYRDLNKEYTTYEDVYENIRESIDSNRPKKLGSSAGISADGKEITIWRYGDDLYIDARTTTCNQQYADYIERQKNIPLTTGKEIFGRREETGIEVMGNGGNVVALPIETCTNAEVMTLALFDFINMSLMESNVIQINRSVTSVRGNNDWTGICVTDNVLEALSKNGSIYNSVKSHFGCNLKIIKSRGRKSKELVERGLNRLIEISW
jgi:hypothetical protein